uniref:Uncharacterized protein n=1 Tax=Caenorhabditis tropicalis TaxID=1561998 RepID=A0A1I7U259_9PELO
MVPCSCTLLGHQSDFERVWARPSLISTPSRITVGNNSIIRNKMLRIRFLPQWLWKKNVRRRLSLREVLLISFDAANVFLNIPIPHYCQRATKTDAVPARGLRLPLTETNHLSSRTLILSSIIFSFTLLC